MWTVSVYNFSHAVPGEAAACSGDHTTCCFETEAFSSSACCYRQTFLGDIAALLVPVAGDIDSRSAGDRCAMAPGRLQAVLDLALAPSGSRGQEGRQR